MRDVCVDAWFEERVKRGSCGATPNEPGLEPRLRRIRELASFPDIVAVAADQVRTTVSIGLRKHHQGGFTDLGSQGGFASPGASFAIKTDMRRRQLSPLFDSIGVCLAGRFISFVLATFVLRYIEVL